VLADAWAGLRYTWRNRTLRGLGFMITLSNLAHGMTSIVLPLLIIERFGLSEVLVGVVFAVSGVAGMLSSFAFGRMDTRGKEWALLVWPQIALVPVVALLVVAAGLPALPLGLALLAVEMALVGILIGPMDIGLFTVRQRRTEPAWMGRAFAVSMAFNYLGMPVGAALAGLLADRSIEAAIVVLGIGGSILASLAAWFLVPRTDASAGGPRPVREAAAEGG
jgi:predicted MFS family arabinose efflux permease